MSSQTIVVNDDIVSYLLNHVREESQTARELREKTSPMRESMMQISQLQGAVMAWLIRLLGAKRTIEVGTFTGYSALSVAEALPEDGELIACDVSKEWTDIGREHWEKAGVDSKISLHIQPANETLNALLEQGQAGSFDFAFIDADKTNYDSYYELCLQLLKVGGVVAIDNVLWSGRVASASAKDESTLAIRALNDKVAADERVNAVMLPIGDGLTLAVKN